MGKEKRKVRSERRKEQTRRQTEERENLEGGQGRGEGELTSDWKGAGDGGAERGLQRPEVSRGLTPVWRALTCRAATITTL